MGTEYEGYEICASTTLTACFDALKPAWLKQQLLMELVRIRGYGARAIWGRVPPPSSAARSDIGCRREEWKTEQKEQKEDSWAPGLRDRRGGPVL